jgi:hypothetical protein
MNRKAPLSAALVVSALLGLVPGAPAQQPASDRWRPFTATWSLDGERQLIETEGKRPGSIVHLTGPLTLTRGEGLRAGFYSEVIGFDDGEALLVGRIVLVDDRSDRIFCTFRAEPIGNGRHATATIVGGSGRFEGLTGEFSFSWQYVVDVGEGRVSLRSVDVAGRTRRTGAPR